MEFYEPSTITNIIHNRCLYLPPWKLLDQKPLFAWLVLAQSLPSKLQAFNNGGWPNGEDEVDEASPKIT